MRRFPLTLIIVAAALTAAPSKKQRTTRRPLRTHDIETVATAYSAVTLDEADIILAGYDKPLRSRRETIFATNASPDSLPISSLRITITYRDISGRQLHHRSVWVNAEIPPGQTRQLSFPSWDTQQSFYYHRSKPPHSVAAPYDITAVADSAKIIIRRY